MEKILVVGDLHGDWSSLNKLIAQKKPHIVLQCGDFGWWPKFERRKLNFGDDPEWILKGIKPGSSKIYWCDGNHEDHEDLDAWQHEGKRVQVYNNVFFQPRGSTLELPDGRVVLFYGGARSVDKESRTRGFDWFPQEIPYTGHFKRACDNYRADIVISHTCPMDFPVETSFSDKGDDPVRHDLSHILYTYEPPLWFFGHWHVNQKGQSGVTKWEALAYPHSGRRWWRFI